MKKPAVAEILHTPIAVILSSYPQVSRVFIRNRMGCIGCAFSKFHTPQDAIEIYQLDGTIFIDQVRDFLPPAEGLEILNT